MRILELVLNFKKKDLKEKNRKNYKKFEFWNNIFQKL